MVVTQVIGLPGKVDAMVAVGKIGAGVVVAADAVVIIKNEFIKYFVLQ